MPDPAAAGSTTAPAAVAAGREVSRWRFANVELDEATLLLSVGGEAVAIEPKPLEMLMWLLRHPGEVVTKDELLEVLWLGRVVSETVLTTCVRKVRSAIGDDAHEIVKTVHRFGYRLAVPVQRQVQPSVANPQARLSTGDVPPHRPGWRLLRRLGGSLGENWLVEQTQSRERRVLKFAFDAPGLARLKREVTLNRVLRETLGPRDDLLGVLDWNFEQPPFFVELEYCTLGSLVDGLDAERMAGLDPAARLELAAQVADAVAAAHSAGVLHKDIKPANVMAIYRADGTLQVKVADFGSGAVVDDARLAALRITRMGFTQEIDGSSGTYGYLAPELIAGQPPTARSDIYALGVLTWQLAVGDLQRTMAPGWERDIADELLQADIGRCCDQDPARRFGDAAEVAGRLRGLDARRAALAAEREAESAAAALQADLVRSRQRRRWLAAVATVASIGFLVAAAMALQIREARSVAEAQALAAKSVNDYLVRDLLGSADPMSGGLSPSSGDVPVRALLERAASGVAQRFVGQPRLEAAVRTSLGQAFFGLAEFPAAADQYANAAQLARGAGDALAEATAWIGAAQAARDLDRYDDADAHLAAARKALTGTGASGLQRRAEVEQNQGWVLYKRGDYERSIATMQAGLPELRRGFGDPSNEVATALEQLSTVQLAAGQMRPAVESARAALATRLRIDAAEHPRVIASRAALGDALRWVGDDESAEREIRTAHALAIKVLGPDHHATLVAQGSLASMLQQLKRYDEAIALFEDTVARSRRVYGELNYDTTVHLNNLGLAYADAGRLSEAVVTLQEAIDHGRKLLGAEHPELIKNEHNLADVLADAGRWQEALAIEDRLLPAAREAFGPRHFLVGAIQRTRGRSLLGMGRDADAESALREARPLLVEQFGEKHGRVLQVDQLLAEASRRKPAR